MANPAEDDFEDIRYIPPPVAPSSAQDDLPLTPFPDDDPHSSQLSSSSSSSPASHSLTSSLLTTWQNELHCPQLLPYSPQLIQSLLTLFDSRQSSIDSLPPTTPSWESELYQLEIDRLTYLLTDYHRVRLSKIEKHCSYLLSSDERMGLMSVAEKKFAKRYADVWGGVMEGEYLRGCTGLLPMMKGVTGEEMIVGWDEGAHVIFRAKENVGEVEMSERGEEEPMEVREGDVWIARYAPLEKLKLVQQGKIELI